MARGDGLGEAIVSATGAALGSPALAGTPHATSTTQAIGMSARTRRSSAFAARRASALGVDNSYAPVDAGRVGDLRLFRDAHRRGARHHRPAAAAIAARARPAGG